MSISPSEQSEVMEALKSAYLGFFPSRINAYIYLDMKYKIKPSLSFSLSPQFMCMCSAAGQREGQS